MQGVGHELGTHYRPPMKLMMHKLCSLLLGLLQLLLLLPLHSLRPPLEAGLPLLPLLPQLHPQPPLRLPLLLPRHQQQTLLYAP